MRIILISCRPAVLFCFIKIPLICVYLAFKAFIIRLPYVSPLEEKRRLKTQICHNRRNIKKMCRFCACFTKTQKMQKKAKKNQKRACNLFLPVIYYHQLKGTAQTVADLLKVGVKTAESIIVTHEHIDKHLTERRFSHGIYDF